MGGLLFLVPTCSTSFKNSDPVSPSPAFTNSIGRGMVFMPANIKHHSFPPAENLESSALAIKLMGDRNNPFAIRRDILEYILSAIEESNISAINAAIHYAQYDLLIYFNQNPVQAREYAEWLGNASLCLSAFIGDEKGGEISLTIAQLYRNTPKRQQWMWEIESEVLGWHVFAGAAGALADKTNAEAEEFCRAGGKYWK